MCAQRENGQQKERREERSLRWTEGKGQEEEVRKSTGEIKGKGVCIYVFTCFSVDVDENQLHPLMRKGDCAC